MQDRELYGAMLHNIKVVAPIRREDINELGQPKTYRTVVDFPILIDEGLIDRFWPTFCLKLEVDKYE